MSSYFAATSSLVAVGQLWRFCVITSIAFVGAPADGAVVHHIHGVIEGFCCVLWLCFVLWLAIEY
jgi:hypothetical protein